MSETTYAFTPALQIAYSAVHKELENNNDAKGYRDLGREEKKELLEKTSFKYAAAQFHRYFPPHYFKARYLLDHLIEERVLNSWIDNNSHLVLIDAGCGAGAASAAYIQKLAEICETKAENRHLYCVAFDPDKYALVLYNRLMTNFLKQLDSSRLIVDFTPLPLGIPALKPLIDQLDLKRQEWGIPRIPNVLLLRMNIDKPLSKRYIEQKETEELFKQYGVPITEEINYGDEEADTYESVLRNANIDHLNIVAVATRNNDSSKSNHANFEERSLEHRLKEFSISLERISEKNGHAHSRIECNTYSTKFINPENSYYENNKQVTSTTYFASANFISDKSLTEDIRWDEMLSTKNLQTAWAKARRNLLQEALYDEVEIRLFEEQLELNLSNLSNRLANYVNNIFTHDQTIAFKTIKASGEKRPRGLSRFEEEILFTAIIEDVSKEYSGRYPNSYAYQVRSSRGHANEFLYGDWFTAYNSYIQNAVQSAIKYATTGAIIQTDIQKFYEKIIQERLLDIGANELYRYSGRVEWLLRSLVERDYLQHDEGRGLSQGSIGSGFFANVYLSPLHRFFQEMDVEFFRYVDDMIIIVKNAEEVDRVLENLSEFVNSELGLKLNSEKTVIYTNVDEFIDNVESNNDLDELHQNHQSFFNLIWVGDSDFRTILKQAYSDDDAWWDFLKRYQKYLSKLSIFVDLTTLSRRVRTNLFNEENIAVQLKETTPLTIPDMPESLTAKNIYNWTQGFRAFNPDFVRELEYHRTRIHKIFVETYKSIDLRNVDKKAARKLKFMINKLATLGMWRIRQELVEIVIQAPWLLEISYTFENMAVNGLYEELDQILDHYNRKKETTEREYVMAMALKSVRYFPELSQKNTMRLFEYGTRSPSLIERIMATETILIRRKDIPSEVLERYLPTILSQLNEGLNPRLEKNYVLLLGNQVPSTYIPNATDDMLRNAKYIALNDKTDSLFENVEHPLLRRQYYGAFDTQEEYRYFG